MGKNGLIPQVASPAWQDTHAGSSVQQIALGLWMLLETDSLGDGEGL